MSLKIYSYWFIITAAIIPFFGYTQTRDKFSIDYSQKTVEYILKDFQEKYNVPFAYSPTNLNLEQVITIQNENISISEFLSELSQEAGFTIKERAGKYVIIPAKRSKVYLSGFVKEDQTGETLIGATVIRSDSLAGTISNEFGYFSIPVFTGSTELIFSFVGFDSRSIEVNVDSDSIIMVSLSTSASLLEEIEVAPNDSIRVVELIRENAISLNAQQISNRITAFGEEDVVKSLDQIAGIQLFRDGSSFFNVRGGNRDQNQILVDDAPVYNPAHFFGLYSSIIPEAIKDIKLYKGDFPVRYGGRISSVLDIRTRDGDMKTHHLEGGLGFVSARFLMEGPLVKNKSSYMLSARRSYIGELVGRNDDSFERLYFRDFNLKLNHIKDNQNRFYLSVFNGKDQFQFDTASGISWGNTGGSFRWNHLLNERTFINITLYGSRYDYKLSGNPTLTWRNHIANLSGKIDANFLINESNTLKYGLRLSGHNFNPGNLEDSTGSIPAGYEFVPKKNAIEASLYIGHEWEIAQNLFIDYGIRVSSWSNHGRTIEYIYEGSQVVDTLLIDDRSKYNEFSNLEPRFSLTYHTGSNSFLKLNYTRSAQYINLISNSISPFNNLEIWLPSSLNLKPLTSHQLSTGWHKLSQKWQFDFDVYGKIIQNQVDYQNQAQLLLNATIENQLLAGTGISFGVETSLTKTYGRLQGSFTYVLSRSLLYIEDINNNEPYPTLWDRPHQLSFQLNYKMKDRIRLSGSVYASSGAAISTPTSFYEYRGRTVPYYSSRNNSRLPGYFRTDAAVTFQLHKNDQNRFKHYLQFSIFNLLNNKNSVLFNFNKIADEGNFIVPRNIFSEAELQATQLYVYTWIPSINYTFRL